MIREVFLTEGCIFDLTGDSKEAIFTQMSQRLQELGRIGDANAFKEALYLREQQGPTGLGEGIAIPHGKSASVKAPTVILGVHPTGISYESLDDEPIRYIFMIAVPETSDDQHLKILSSLCRKMVHDEFKEGLRNATTGEDVLALL